MIWLALLLAVMILVPAMGGAQTQSSTAGQPPTEPSFFLEGYVGAGASSSDLKVSGATFTGDFGTFFQGGKKFGYWFTPYGTHPVSWAREWTKYIGVYTDLSYHELNHPNNVVVSNGIPLANGNSFGWVFTWAFMAAGRVGFLPDSEVPFGRLQPYVSFGPAIYFSGQDFNIGGFTGGSDSATNIGLATEGGLRYFIARNISAEASFKYRYFAPNYYFRPFGTNVQANMNLFTGQFGLAFHF